MKNELNKAFASFGLDTTPSEGNVGKAILGLSERQIMGRTVTVIDRLDKAKLFYNINDVIADFFVEKTGKEIKEKLVLVKQYDDAEAQAAIVKANEHLIKCSCQPKDSTSIGDYELRGMKMKFGTIPMMFTWEEVNAFDDANRTPPPIQMSGMTNVNESVQSIKESSTAPIVKLENPYRLYNQCIRLYVESRVESLVLDTVINNIDDNKSYKLSAEQASKLGF